MCRVLTWLVVATVGVVASSSASYLCVDGGHCFIKCCPQNFFLVYDPEKPDITPHCMSEVSVEKNETKNIDLKVMKSKWNCTSFMEVKMTFVEDSWPMCVENLAANKSVLASVLCEKNEVFNTMTFKKCCRENYKYDLKRHVCLAAASENFEVNDFLADKSLNFDAIALGMPDCDGALVDFTLQNNSGITALEMMSSDVCVDRIFGEDRLLGGRRCHKKTLCDKIPCVRKCCPPGQSFIGKLCADSKIGFNPLFYDVLIDNPDNYGMIHGRKGICPLKSYRVRANDPNERFFLGEYGYLIVNKNESINTYSIDEYCLEHFTLPNNYSAIDALICFKKATQDRPPIWEYRYVIIAIAVICSCFFLFTTFVVYLCLPVLQNLHGMTLMCHVASFFVAYVCLATNQLGNNSFKPKVVSCIILGFVQLFAFLASFAWMNMMCFDIWWTFGGVRSIQHTSGKSRVRKRFAWYSLYAWGVPTFITTLALVGQFVKPPLPGLCNPRMGEDRCWFPRTSSKGMYDEGARGQTVYFLVPITLFISCNVVLFVLTARSCSKVKAEINRMRDATDENRKKKFQADKNKLMMNGKLFFVMGVCWVIELIGTLFPNIPPIWWLLPDALNSLQGVFIFVIFVLKPKILKALSDRLPDACSRLVHRESAAQYDQNLRHGNDCNEMRKSSMSSTCFTTTTSAGPQP